MRVIDSDIPVELFNSIEWGMLDYNYRGVPCLKNPFDLALLPMLFWKVEPQTIIEWGSFCGGNAIPLM
jgi:cephalosporin hydroxylase